MQMLGQIPYSPFGSGRLSPDVLKINALVQECAPGSPAHKWKVFRDISGARKVLGVPDRALIVLNALLSFHPDVVLTAGSPDLVVFPSNRQLSLRSHGMAASTLRRHLAVLVENGLILRRDSPNGKRFARKSADGEVEVAFGFDLGPIIARAAEFQSIASRIREESTLARQLRQRVSVLRRDVLKMIAAGVDEKIQADWALFHGRYQAAIARLPRVPTLETLELVIIELQDLADQVLGVLNSHLRNVEIGPVATENPPSTRDVEHICGKAPCIVRADLDISRNRRHQGEQPGEVPLRLVLDACPDIADYARSEIRSCRDLLAAASIVRPLLGVSPSAWEEAVIVMGAEQASAVIAGILQRGVAIKNPGGYLRKLTRRAADRQFSIWPMMMALSAARLKKASAPDRTNL